MNLAEQREEAVFEAALQLHGDQRAAYLNEACAGDAELHRRVEVLLSAFERASGFMQDPAVPMTARTSASSLKPTEKPGDRIGRYKLLEQIGEGGCGVVYVAEQEEPVRRRVALKVIKLGMDTKQVIARFDAERQALAMMDHPNIAKVFDAGATETGRPYFVMELVRGIKITEYCDQNHLPPRERLDLFIQVCRAIQHAHQKGVIHRDIKPSNILVTLHDGVPVPKVIDFGIAKATQGRLTDQTVYTAFEQFIGTPAYMSPEQAEMSGLDIDTRSDIYSLGVLLYELLTGKTPFDAKELLAAGLDEMRRTIREVEPVKPSTRLTQDLVVSSAAEAADHARSLRQRTLQQVRGDLDWIVMKCLEKDRTRRYQTANGLATDIQRHLCNEPVVARPPSRFYRFQKSVQRNKLAFGAATAVALALVIGLAVSTAMFFKAKAEKKKAQTEAAKSQQVAQFLKDMLQGVGPRVALGRDTKMLREIVDKTTERLSTELKDQPEVEIELRLLLAEVYGDLQMFQKMEEVARETVRLARAHWGEENLAVADALQRLGRAQMCLRALEPAEISTRQAIAMQRKLRGNNSFPESIALENLGHVLRLRAMLSTGSDASNKLAGAEIVTRTALAIRRKRLGNDDDQVAWALNSLNSVLSQQQRYAEAELVIREALAIRIKHYGEESADAAADYEHLAWTLSNLPDRFEEAETYFHKVLVVEEKLGSEGRLLTQMYAHLGLAEILDRQNKLAEAEKHYKESLIILRKQLGGDFVDLPQFVSGLADVLRKEGKLDEARPLAEEAVALCKRFPGRVAHWQQTRAFAVLRDVLRDLGDTAALEKLDLIRKTEKKSEPH